MLGGFHQEGNSEGLPSIQGVFHGHEVAAFVIGQLTFLSFIAAQQLPGNAAAIPTQTMT
ncbi:MAG: hypothetical protein J2P17_02230 [Mycobacterium sp.]|nr:hypothetical protein [Mycobacterium sp.]